MWMYFSLNTLFLRSALSRGIRRSWFLATQAQLASEHTRSQRHAAQKGKEATQAFSERGFPQREGVGCPCLSLHMQKTVLPYYRLLTLTTVDEMKIIYVAQNIGIKEIMLAVWWNYTQATTCRHSQGAVITFYDFWRPSSLKANYSILNQQDDCAGWHDPASCFV